MYVKEREDEEKKPGGKKMDNSVGIEASRFHLVALWVNGKIVSRRSCMMAVLLVSVSRTER